MLKIVRFMTPFAAAALAACAASSGTRPHDMSAAQHEAAAAQETNTAEAHQAQYQPGATSETVCDRSHATKGRVCWTSRTNPTQQHLDDAAAHRELASKHRAASAALTQAEASACAGIDEDDRATSPFFQREDILSVEPLEERVQYGKQHTVKPMGATVTFRAVPGLTAEWLQRQIDCHLARAASLGHNMPDMAYCPLVLKGVTATVSSAGGAFAVKVRSEDAETAKEILRRARAAKAATSSPAAAAPVP